MEIATVVNCHNDLDLIRDTISSISTYVTKKLLVFIDGSADQEVREAGFMFPKVIGFRHGVGSAPYRNVALALKTLTEVYPTADWYCYCEQDVLFTSDRFKHNLGLAAERRVWMLGNDGRVDDVNLGPVASLVGGTLPQPYYLLGCCQFFHKAFIERLKDIGFFDRFLSLTNGFAGGHFPGYSGFDVSEHLYPTLCRYFQGNIGVWATYDEEGKWHGKYRCFPCRWKPSLKETENFPEASIMHPLKEYDHPIRKARRVAREQWKTSQMKEKQSDSSSTCRSATDLTGCVY